MTFTTLLFLFALLPVSILGYRLLPGRMRDLFLVLISLLFYAWGSPRDLLLLLLYAGMHYAAGRAIESSKKQTSASATDVNASASRRPTFNSRTILIGLVVIDLAILALYKYTSQVMPIGLSFYTFTALSYLFDIYRGEEALRDPLDLLMVFSFFPKVVSGPIVPYHAMKAQLRDRKFMREDLIDGLSLFFVGLFKKVLLADALGRSFTNLYATGSMASLTAILGMLLYSLQLYLDFSGYSDMAIGLSRVFGFRFPKNFDYPYLSKSFTEFWRRWHISLGTWFRDYVYIPLGGNRHQPFRNLLIVWVLTGLWHGNSLAFLFWGIYHGCLLLLEKTFFHRVREHLPAVINILITDLGICIGWIFFFVPTLGDGFRYIGRFFGTDGRGFADAVTAFYLREDFILLVLAVLCCGPFFRRLQRSLIHRFGQRALYGSMALTVVLFLFTVAALLGATNTSFLYAQF